MCVKVSSENNVRIYCLKDTNKNLVITVNTKAEKKNVERQLKKVGNPNAKVKVSKKK